MSSNTVPKQLKPFVKGDPRINRNGRPKTFDTWRSLNQETMNELAVGKDGKLIVIETPKIYRGEPVLDEEGKPVMEEHYATNAEMIVRSTIRDPKRQRDAVEAAYGKVPDKLDVKLDTTVINVKLLDDESDD